MHRYFSIVWLSGLLLCSPAGMAFGGLPAVPQHSAESESFPATTAALPSLHLLQSLHHFALERHQYVSDQEQYQQQDRWQASLTGDCEDYALWLQQKLTLLAIDSELVWVWQQEQSHMVLLVANQYVIDNLQKNVLTLTEVRTKHPYQRVFGKWQLQDGRHKFMPQDHL